LEVDEAAVKPGEAVRMLMDLGYELILPHFVFAVKKGDPWRVKDLVEKDLPPHVAASFFNVSSRLTYVVTLPDVSAEEAARYLAERGLRAELVNSYQGPSGSALDKGDAAQGVEVGGSGDLRHRLEDVSVGASQTPVEGKEEE
jgi:hypothetical protein